MDNITDRLLEETEEAKEKKEEVTEISVQVETMEEDYTLCHSSVKVHCGVPIVFCIFWDPLVLMINCLFISD